MKIQSKYRGVKGFVAVYNYAVRYQYMITETAKQRCRIFVFWNKHGLQATIDVFKVERRTLFDWKRKLKQRKG